MNICFFKLTDVLIFLSISLLANIRSAPALRQKHMNILDNVTEGRGQEGDIELLKNLAYKVKALSLCGLGQTAPNPILSTLRWFKPEYEAHVFEKRCPAGECRELLSYSIDPDKCIGCMLCKKKCPVDAIMGAKKSPHYIVPDKCIGCGACVDACKKHEAVIVS